MNKCLWSSGLPRRTRRHLLVGDTGYCGDIFKLVGELYPADLAAIPIGAEGVAEERWFHAPNHMSAKEAVQCHIDIRSRKSVGIHWGTFILTGEGLTTPRRKLKEAVAEAGLDDPDEFVTLQHGETLFVEFHR